MLRLFNSLGKQINRFREPHNRTIKIFTCGPSVYQRSHIGNFRTFLFEDILIRYLKYCGYRVQRGMNFTDIEDKAIKESKKRKISLKRLTDENIKRFIGEMKLLRMEMPDYLPKASESVTEAVEIIKQLIEKGFAYWYKENVYFDPLKFPGFGRLYGLDMSRWPSRKKRFHKDTYPGMRWNLGDFILWHGYKEGDRYYWDTKIGKGRPAWNIQDPSMIIRYVDEPLSIYCGGIDNLIRHHDYTLAILESIKPYPMSRFWLHCHHLFVHGQKMSKSKGNIIYTEELREKGYSFSEIRFFLVYGHYRNRLDYSEEHFRSRIDKLRSLKKIIRAIENKAGHKTENISKTARDLKRIFTENMNNDLNVKLAFDGIYGIISGIDIREIDSEEATGIIQTLKRIDDVFRAFF